MSQVSVTGWLGVRVLTSAVQTRVERRRLGAGRADEAGRRPVGVGRAAGRQQADQRALLVDRLAVVLEHEVVELAALEVDRAGDARRVDGDARGRRRAPRGTVAVAAATPGARRRAPRRPATPSPPRRPAETATRPRCAPGSAPAAAPDAASDRAGRRRNTARRPSPGRTGRWRERGFSCPRISWSPVLAFGRVRRRPGGGRPCRCARWRGRPGAGRRPARRTAAQAPRAGPSARNRSRAAPQGARRRASASFSRRRMRLRTTASPTFLVTVKPTRAAAFAALVAGRAAPPAA